MEVGAVPGTANFTPYRNYTLALETPYQIGCNYYIVESKMRFALNAGKSSGVRVLYVDLVLLEEVYLISAYAKSNKSNLTTNEKSEIKKLIDLLKKSAFERRAKNELR